MSSRPWRGTRPVAGLRRQAGAPLITLPLLLAVLMAARCPSRGGCWPWCTATSAAPTAELAQAATGSATRRGRSEYPHRISRPSSPGTLSKMAGQDNRSRARSASNPAAAAAVHIGGDRVLRSVTAGDRRSGHGLSAASLVGQLRG